MCESEEAKVKQVTVERKFLISLAQVKKERGDKMRSEASAKTVNE